MVAFGTADRYQGKSHGGTFVVEEESALGYFFPNSRDHSAGLLAILGGLAALSWLIVEVTGNSVGTQNMPAGDSHNNQRHFVDAAAANKCTLAVEVILPCVYSLDDNAPLEEVEKGNILVQDSADEGGI